MDVSVFGNKLSDAMIHLASIYGLWFFFPVKCYDAKFKFQISKYKRGLRNGPKALKPIPVIVRCL